MKVKQLTVEDIEKFASRKGAKRIAVENFLSSVHYAEVTPHEAFENAKMDARSYGWNDATLGAIIDGIAHASKEG